MGETVAIPQLGRALNRNRKTIFAVCLATIVLSVAVSLVLPKYYKAVATVLPPENSLMQADVGLMMRLAGYKPAQMPAMVSQSDIYSVIMQSTRVKDAVIDSLGLMDVYRAKTRRDALEEVESRLRISVGGEGLVEVAYEDRDPKRSAAAANAFVSELDRFNREARVTGARKVREFIESRIGQVSRELGTAEEELKSFKEASGAILISAQTEASIKTAAEIFGRIAELEVSLERIRQSATERSPEVIDIRSQIRALERKLGEMGYLADDGRDAGGGMLFPKFSTAPELEMRLAELVREAEVKRTVYAVLSEQYEEARIQEMRDTPTIQVLDRAQVPTARSRPKRKVIVAVSTGCAFFLSSFVALYRDRRLIRGQQA